MRCRAGGLIMAALKNSSLVNEKCNISLIQLKLSTLVTNVNGYLSLIEYKTSRLNIMKIQRICMKISC